MTRALWTLFAVAFLGFPLSVGAGQEAGRPQLSRLGIPLLFEENGGQADPSVAFVARTGSAIGLLGRDGLVLRSSAGETLRVGFPGANADPEMRGEDPLPSRSHYYLGDEPARWRRDVRHFARVRYRELWPGIDLVFRGTSDELAFDLIVSPGADPTRAALELVGARSIAPGPGGELVARLERGELRIAAPIVYQDSIVGRHEVAGHFAIEGAQVRFELGPYDPASPLVIDPTLVFATGLGGSGDDAGAGIAVDPRGSIWLVGTTRSLDLPTTPGAAQSTKGDAETGLDDCFVAKLDPAGGPSGLLSLSYFGGSQDDRCPSIAVDGQGEAYVAVTTQSSDFPTTEGAWIPSGFGAAAFKLAADGALLWSTYLFDPVACGCTGPTAVDVAVGVDRAPWIAGSFHAPDDGWQAHITQLSPDGSSSPKGTTLGGPGDEIATALSVGSSGVGVWLVGSTSGQLPITRPLQGSYGGGASDGFVALFGSCAPTPPSTHCSPLLVFSDYLGTNGDEVANDVSQYGVFAVIAGTGNVGASPGALYPKGPGFVRVLDFRLPTVLYSTQMPSVVAHVAVQQSGAAYITGNGTVPLVDSLFDTGRSFLLRLSKDGTSIEFSTRVGGLEIGGIALDSEGAVILGGTIPSAEGASFPSLNPVQPVAPAGDNAAALKLVREVRCADGTFTVQDTDGDGLYDCWETQGIDADGDGVADLDLAPLGADPARKDLFLEIDYMSCAVDSGDCAAGDTHDHAPYAPAIEAVKRAFEDAGIELHIDPIHEALWHVEAPSFTTVGQSDDFEALKNGLRNLACDGAFGNPTDRSDANCENRLQARLLVYRYAIFGHDQADHPGSSGIAELPGNDLLVTLGSGFFDPAFLHHAGGRVNVVGGTLMHLLGHTLGLDHGGGDPRNCKPNYPSVLSFSRQFASVVPTRKLDYSRQQLPSLIESDLDESAGIDGPAATTTAYGVAGAPRVALADLPIDWNGNGIPNETGVVADVNRIDALGCSGDGIGILLGFDDWSHLRMSFRASPDFAQGFYFPLGAVQRTTVPLEAELTAAQATAAARATDADGDGFSNAEDTCPGIADVLQTDSDGDGTGDACDNCPYYPTDNLQDRDGDGRGDECECTDQNGDGLNTVADLVAINLAIFNPALAAPLCDGNNDGLCNVSDIIAANLEIFSPTNTSTCSRQPSPGP